MAQPQPHSHAHSHAHSPAHSQPRQNAARTGTTTTPSTSPADQPIPPLGSIGPAIFVPIAEDLTAPLPPFPSRAARIRAILADVDVHAAAVQANLLTLYAREHARLVHKGTADDRFWRADGGRDITPGLDAPDLALMIANMEAPHDPAVDYNIPDEQITRPDLTGLAGTTPRQWVALDTMRNAEDARMNMVAHEQRVNQSKEAYENALKRALEEEAE